MFDPGTVDLIVAVLGGAGAGLVILVGMRVELRYNRRYTDRAHERLDEHDETLADHEERILKNTWHRRGGPNTERPRA